MLRGLPAPPALPRLLERPVDRPANRSSFAGGTACLGFALRMRLSLRTCYAKKLARGLKTYNSDSCGAGVQADRHLVLQAGT